MTFEEEFAQLYKRMMTLCNKHNAGNPFVGGRGNEIHMANTLGHRICATFSGADAYNGDVPVEYKSSSGEKFTVTYGGISVQETIEQQIAYLKDKILPYKEHYCARYNKDGTINEVWKLDSKDVYKLLEPRVISKFYNSFNNKDPRISVNISKGDIQRYGELVYSDDGLLPL